MKPALHRLLIVLVAGLMPSIPCTASTEEGAGKAAYITGNHKKAFHIWSEKAKEGEAEAQFNLAFLYETGQGTERDLLAAASWYELAARQNYPGSKIKLREVKTRIFQNRASELRKWQSKAEEGDPESQLVLSEIYKAGNLTDQNLILSLKWILLAEESALNPTLKARISRQKSLLLPQLTKEQKRIAVAEVQHWKDLRKPPQ